VSYKFVFCSKTMIYSFHAAFVFHHLGDAEINSARRLIFGFFSHTHHFSNQKIILK